MTLSWQIQAQKSSSNNLDHFYKHVNNRLYCHTSVGARRDTSGFMYATDASKAELLYPVIILVL